MTKLLILTFISILATITVDANECNQYFLGQASHFSAYSLPQNELAQKISNVYLLDYSITKDIDKVTDYKKILNSGDLQFADGTIFKVPSSFKKGNRSALSNQDSTKLVLYYNSEDTDILSKYNKDDLIKKEQILNINTKGFYFSDLDGVLKSVTNARNTIGKMYLAASKSGVSEKILKRLYIDIFKLEQITNLYLGRLKELPISMFMSLPIEIRFPRYHYSLSHHNYKALEARSNFGVNALLYNATNVIDRDKNNYQNLFGSFIKRMQYDSSYHPDYFIQNFSYVDGDKKQFSFSVFSPKNLKDIRKRAVEKNTHPFDREIPTKYKNLAEDARKFVISQYKKRMKLGKKDASRLIKISRDAEDRTVLVISTNEMSEVFTKFKDGKKHFSIDGVISAVLSKSSDQKLPLESFAGIDILRNGSNEVLMEVGRFAITGEKISSDNFVKAISALAKSTDDVSRVIIEADAARARLFKRFGFQPIHDRINFEGNREFVMEVSPEILSQKISEVLK